MREVITAVFLGVGALAMLLAGLGMVRLPDLFLRLQATAKAATLGVGGLLCAAAVNTGSLGGVAHALLTVLFLFAITPVATLLIARAAFHAGVPLWKKTGENDLAEKYRAEARPPSADSLIDGQ
ncbi:monovalent cation/H(+) antiporter subunit G [Stigmatella erecta]|uniref:Multisubunit sodium/proton antiporter, MrpG subunit n=1 Tax=Stigmatella erecta TaxID=83460 RepID=A0A1I0L669_9BACT|nr:monovalent cation/H(+) antiporter subunit G [Stigmatella erecta]SEU34245.1 multisubunit sodium/proton antiporter, MrpG subunit [Stigmatella erecta]